LRQVYFKPDHQLGTGVKHVETAASSTSLRAGSRLSGGAKQRYLSLPAKTGRASLDGTAENSCPHLVREGHAGAERDCSHRL